MKEAVDNGDLLVLYYYRNIIQIDKLFEEESP